MLHLSQSEIRRLNEGKYKGYVDIGTVTDAYQPAERKYALMPKILEVFLRYRYPVTVLTKSDLVLRDIGLWRRLSQERLGVVGMTITTPPSMPKPFAQFLEPYAPSSEKRISTVEKLARAGIGVYIFVDPVVPIIGDNAKGLNELVHRLAQSGARGLFVGVMKLSSLTWSLFRKRLTEFKPELLSSFEDLYFKRGFKEFGKSWCPPDEYTESLYQTIRAACIQHKIGFSCERFYHLWTEDCWTIEEPYGHPTGYNLWKIIAVRNGDPLRLSAFLNEVRTLNRVTDRSYLDSVTNLWNAGVLLRGVKGIEHSQAGGNNEELCYTYQP